MPGESTDPIQDLDAAVHTMAGTQEASLRAQLGDVGYEQWKQISDQSTHIQLRSARASAGVNESNVSYVKAKVAVWNMAAFALLVGSLLLVAWSVWVWAR